MTTSTDPERRSPGRPPNADRDAAEAARLPRDDETLAPRRKQRGGGELSGQRLGVPLSMLDLERFVYRWINNDEARLFAKTVEDDWTIVAKDGETCDSADVGNAVSRIVGSKPDGSSLVAYLCRKPRRYYDEDQAGKSAELDRQLEQMRRGKTRTGEEQADYVPASGIRLG